MSKAKRRTPKAAQPQPSASVLVKALEAMPIEQRNAELVDVIHAAQSMPGCLKEAKIDKPRERTEGEMRAEAIEALDGAVDYLTDARDIAAYIERGGPDGTRYFDDITLSRSCRLLIEEAGRIAERGMQAVGKKFKQYEARFLDEEEARHD